jgi:hypothetical protein
MNIIYIISNINPTVVTHQQSMLSFVINKRNIIDLIVCFINILSRRQQQNGAPRVGGYARANQQHQHNEQAGGPSKFCHECGSEFPVQWARFCSYCGDRRL